MDLGFGALLDKFEEYFGTRITKWLLTLIGIALVAACVSIIWTWMVGPILAFFETPLWQRTLANLALAALGIGAGISVGLSLTASLARWRHVREIRKILAETEEQHRSILDEARAATDAMRVESDALLNQTRNTLDNAAGMTDQARELIRLAILAGKDFIEANVSLSEEQRAQSLARLEQAKQVLNAQFKASEHDE